MSRQGPISVYLNRRMAALVGLGFASGLPYVLAGDTLSAWLSALHVDVKSIGLFSLVGLPYALKFLWAPLIDRYIPPGMMMLPLLRGAIGDDRQLEDTMTDADGAIPSNEAARKIASAGAD